MEKDSQFSFRINLKLLEGLRSYCKRKGISMSIFLNITIQDVMDNDSKNTENISKELKIYLSQRKRKLLCSRLYIIKNMYRRIMDMAFSSYFSTGNVNMKSINAVLDVFVEEFENYPDDLKKKILTDFKITVKRLRNQEFLMNQSKNYKMLQYVEK